MSLMETIGVCFIAILIIFGILIILDKKSESRKPVHTVRPKVKSNTSHTSTNQSKHIRSSTDLLIKRIEALYTESEMIDISKYLDVAERLENEADMLEASTGAIVARYAYSQTVDTMREGAKAIQHLALLKGGK